ncbi:MAG: YdgA family protein [Thermodesulfobacteriota bacterium]
MIRKFRIILAIIVFISILAVGVTAFVFGIKAENTYSKWVEHWAEVSNLRVVSKKYHRGWFSSDAESIFEYSKGGRPILTLSEHDYVVHGPIALKAILQRKIKLEPFLAHIKTEVRVQLNNRSDLADMLKLLPPLKIDSVFSFQGDGTSNISMQSFSYRHENLKEFLTWKGLSGNSSFVPNGHKLRMDLDLPGLEIIDDDFSSSFSNAEISLNLEDAKNKLNGQLDSISFKAKNVEIHNFSVGMDEIKSLSLDGLESSWSSVVKDGLINGSQKFGFDKLVVNESNKFGPGAFQFSVRNIASDAFHEITKSIDSLGGEVITNQQKGSRTLGRIMKYLPRLADDHAEFEVTKLSLSTPDGEFMANAKVYIDGKSSQLRLSPFYAIGAVNADAMVTVPKAMFEDIIKEIAREEIKEAIKQKGEQMPDEDVLSSIAESAANEKVKGLLQLNIFVLKDQKYEIRLVYSKGVLELNGKSLPTPFVSP